MVGEGRQQNKTSVKVLQAQADAPGLRAAEQKMRRDGDQFDGCLSRLRMPNWISSVVIRTHQSRYYKDLLALTW